MLDSARRPSCAGAALVALDERKSRMEALNDPNAMDAMVARAQHAFSACDDAAQLANVKARFLGRDGELTALM
ncbi:MAG: hypothetical protein EBX67_03755, partial [Betaproteobacteria bacterium]|nr:hypothetical protein [Betaproteobacteria bacterium]